MYVCFISESIRDDNKHGRHHMSHGQLKCKRLYGLIEVNAFKQYTHNFRTYHIFNQILRKDYFLITQFPT